ncbi:MAG TPA: LysR substrate-binding domain-containing protein [Casimicrobiaceae bacterium]|nr:LysR substrate-binding domain-containing protein [Casimicrobiaceae bacterium]
MRHDLDLLHTFRAVHAARSVSRAAERLGVSQPTVSHALGRLRLAYRDPLFVRAQGGMVPTPRADRLAKAVEHALRVLDVAQAEGERFDPPRSLRMFRLHMTDIGETVFLPPLMKALASRAPGTRLDVHQLDDHDILPALESGRIDLALGYLPSLAETVERRFLLHERYVVVMRAGHPLGRRRPGRGLLKRLDYVLVRSHSTTARALQDLGLQANIRLAIPHFMVLPRILAETDLAVIMPERLSQAFTRMGRYRVWKANVGLPVFDVSVHWYGRFGSDPGNRWLRGLIESLFGEA